MPREPTSFKLNWLGCYSLSVCASHLRTHHYTLRMAWERRVLPKGVLPPQDRCAFQLVPVCTIYRVVVYISGSIPLLVWHTIFPCGAHHNYWCPWVGVSWNDASGPICGQHATSVATQVIKCGCRKIGEQWYALIPGGLANWNETVL